MNHVPVRAFDEALERLFGERLRGERTSGFAERLYGSLTNMKWRRGEGEPVSFTFRGAGALIAEMIGDGDYMDWYCSAPEGVVDEEVRVALDGEGWTPEAWKE
jgi:hypothetical protein